MPNNNRTSRQTAVETIGELQPLNPRSIVLSVLLGSHPPRMPVRRILEFTSLFDVAQGTVRTTLSRMVAAGDLVNVEGVYALAERLVARQAQQDSGRHNPPTDWDGTWWTVAVVSDRRTVAERRSFRSGAVGARLGELRPDLWFRPANLHLATEFPDAIVTRGPVLAGDEQRLVRQLWDLDSLRTQAAAHLHDLDDVHDRLHQGSDRALADAFVRLAAAQHFLRAEPQLPNELAPDSGAPTVRARYTEVVDVFQGQLSEFFASRSSSAVSTAVT